MRKSLWYLMGISALCLVSLAQDRANAGSDVSSSSQELDGVSVRTTTLSTAGGTATARIYAPKALTSLPGVVISHSQVKGANGTIDLLPLAMRIAKSGAAVVVVERALVWPVASPDVNHEGGTFTIAALHWLLAHENVDSKRCAYIGPKFRDPAYPDNFRNLGYEDGVASAPWVGLAETSNALVMKELGTQEGQTQIEEYLQRALGYAGGEKNPIVKR